MKSRKRTSIALFIIYLLLLSWIILMKTNYSISDIYRMRSLNLIPLAGTAIRDNQLDYQEIYLNVLIFLPFGLYLSNLKRDWSFFRKLFLMFLVSLFFESLQYYFSIGASDITDLIANTIGGSLGIIGYFIFEKLTPNSKNKRRLFNILAISGTLFFLFTYFLLNIF